MMTGEKSVLLEKDLSDCKIGEVRNRSYESPSDDARFSLPTMKRVFMTR